MYVIKKNNEDVYGIYLSFCCKYWIKLEFSFKNKAIHKLCRFHS